MSNRKPGMDDWMVPAVLVGLSLVLALVTGVAFAVSAEQSSEAPALIQEIEIYTACLADNGADVPRVEVRRGGAFAVVVPGSLVDGEVDESAWRQAADACAGVAPDLFGAILGGFPFDGITATAQANGEFDAPFDGLIEVEKSPLGWGRHPWKADHPRLDREMPPYDGLLPRCERLATAASEWDGPRIDRLRRHCERFDQ